MMRPSMMRAAETSTRIILFSFCLCSPELETIADFEDGSMPLSSRVGAGVTFGVASVILGAGRGLDEFSDFLSGEISPLG